jgi:hypothetical protein
MSFISTRQIRQVVTIILGTASLLLIGCGAPSHVVEGQTFSSDYGDSQKALQFYRESFDTGAQKLPHLPSSGKRLAVCYGTDEELKNMSDTSGDPVKGEIFRIISEGLVKAVSQSGIFTTIDTVPASATLRECKEKGDDFLLNVTPHANGVGELFNCRTADKTVIAGQTMTELTQPGSIESLQRSFVGQISVVVQQELNGPKTVAPVPAP